MNSIYNEYAALQAMVKLYLLNEYSPDARITTPIENYEYFKNYALQQKKPIPPKHTSPFNSVQKKADEKGKAQPSMSPPSPLPEPTQSKEKINTETHFSKPFDLNPLGTSAGIDLTDIHRRFIENFPGHPVIEKIPFESVKTGDPRSMNIEDPSLKGGDCLNPNLEKVSNPLQNAELKDPGLRAWVSPNLIKAVVVAFGEEPEHRTFFNNLSKAINDSLCPAAVVESKEIQSILDSTELRIFIAQEKETLADAYLSQLIEKLRQKNVTIIFLSPIENYLSTSKLKTQLWRNIKSCVGSF